MKKYLIPFLTILFIASNITAQNSIINLRDGRIFDQGLKMTKESETAPSELKKLRPLIGNWNVALKTRTSDSTFHETRGYSRFSFMNRGHSVMEKFYCADFNGKGDELNTISFIAFFAQGKKWNIGIVDSYKENIMVYNGGNSGEEITVHNSVRKGGWMNLFHYRYSIRNLKNDSFDILLEMSKDQSGEYVLVQEQKYTKAGNDFNVTFENETYGKQNPALSDEAKQFNFLIGEWIAHQKILMPNNKYVEFDSEATAVFALNGNAIMEHLWYDKLSGVTDVAISVLRIYNRSMRRWECLFLTNNNNTNYYFGGVKEGDDIVLHAFENDAGSGPYSYFIFYNISENDYSWHGKQTTDRGKTFKKTWIIEVDKKEG